MIWCAKGIGWGEPRPRHGGAKTVRWTVFSGERARTPARPGLCSQKAGINARMRRRVAIGFAIGSRNQWHGLTSPREGAFASVASRTSVEEAKP
jgi:hypothetical protein